MRGVTEPVSAERRATKTKQLLRWIIAKIQIDQF
jgi:hypothetical protein